MKVETVVEDVVMQPMKIQPIIVNFKNGKLKNEEAKNLKCNLFYDEAEGKTVLGLSNNQIVYKGYRPNPKDDTVYTMLAIHNKRTGKVRLIQAERWDVAPVLNEKFQHNSEVNNDQILALNKQFGSKKVKRRTEQYERMRVNVDSVKDQLEKTAANIEIDRSELEPQDLNCVSDENIPPCNRNATMVEDVYNVHDIIPADKLERLMKKTQDILKNLEGKSQFYLKTLNVIENNGNKIREIAILEYMNGICNWLKMPVKDAKKKSNDICPVDSDISEFIIETYSMRRSNFRIRPNSTRDKAVIHCFILGLMINNYKLDIELLNDQMKCRLGYKKMIDLSRITGAVPSRENKNSILLKVPLPPPLSLIKRGRKMR